MTMLLSFAVRYWRPAIFVVLLVVASGMAFKLGVDTTRGKFLAQQQEATAEVTRVLTERTRKVTEASIRAAEAEQRIRTRTRVITKEIVREVEKPVYRECVVPADGVRLLNDARRGSSGASPGARDGPLRGDPGVAGGGHDGRPRDR